MIVIVAVVYVAIVSIVIITPVMVVAVTTTIAMVQFGHGGGDDRRIRVRSNNQC